MFSFFALLGLFVAVSADAYGGGVPAPITTTAVTTQPRHFLRPDPFQSFPQQQFQQQFQQDFQPRTVFRQGFVPQVNPTQMISFQRQAQPIQYPFEIYQRPQPTNLGYGASSYGLPPQPVPTAFVVQEQPTTVSGGFSQVLPQTLPQSLQQGSFSPTVLSSINEPSISFSSANQIGQSASAGSAYGPPPAAAHRPNYPTPAPHLLHINDVSAQSEEIDSETPKATNEHGFRRWRLAHKKIRA